MRLFDVATLDAPHRAPLLTGPDPHELEAWAFLYTATDKGNHSGIRFLMSMEHAREWCSSDASKGRAHGTCWAFFFTSVGKFLENHGVGSKLDARKLVDDGRFDKTFVELGLRKFGFDEFPDVLGPFGLEVIL